MRLRKGSRSSREWFGFCRDPFKNWVWVYHLDLQRQTTRSQRCKKICGGKRDKDLVTVNRHTKKCDMDGRMFKNENSAETQTDWSLFALDFLDDFTHHTVWKNSSVVHDGLYSLFSVSPYRNLHPVFWSCRWNKFESVVYDLFFINHDFLFPATLNTGGSGNSKWMDW